MKIKFLVDIICYDTHTLYYTKGFKKVANLITTKVLYTNKTIPAEVLKDEIKKLYNASNKKSYINIDTGNNSVKVQIINTDVIQSYKKNKEDKKEKTDMNLTIKNTEKKKKKDNYYYLDKYDKESIKKYKKEIKNIKNMAKDRATNKII